MDDIINLIIYLAIGIAGLLVSAYRNKQKRKAQSIRTPREITTEPLPDVQPDLGPLAELFGIPEAVLPRPVEVPVVKEITVEEEGYRVEEEGLLLDIPDPETMQPASALEKEGLNVESIDYEGTPAFKSTEETMISDSIMDSAITDSEGIYEPISASEIKGVEDMEKDVDKERINWRKAVIYSEILQRKGN
jgi:hypothetical protein